MKAFINFRKKTRTFTKISIVTASLLALLVLSEAIYQYRNQDVQIRVYLELSKFFASYSKLNLAMNFLNKASDIRISQVIQEYPDNAFPKKTIALTPIYNQNLSEEYLSYIKTFDTSKLSQLNPIKLGKVYYALGLAAHKNSEEQLVIPFWQRAIYLAPQWSYFHIELANYYLSEGMVEEAKDSLSYCLKFRHPKEHCQWYIENFLEKSSFDSVGFLETKIDEEI